MLRLPLSPADRVSENVSVDPAFIVTPSGMPAKLWLTFIDRVRAGVRDTWPVTNAPFLSPVLRSTPKLSDRE